MVRKEKCYINCVLLCKCEVPMEVSGPGERGAVWTINRCKGWGTGARFWQFHIPERVTGWVEVSTGN